MRSFEIFDRDELSALWRVATHRPIFTVLIVVFGVATAFLEGIGLSFILPIVEFARSSGPAPSAEGGPVAIFAKVYAFLGVPFTLEHVIWGVIAVMAVRYGATLGMAWFRILLRTDYERSVKLDAFESAVDASISYFDRQGSDEILNAVITQATQASAVIKQLVDLAQQSMITVMYFVVALYFAPILTVLTVVGLGGITYLVRYIIEPGQAIGSRLAEANEEIQIAAQAGTQGIRDAKLFGMMDLINDRFAEAVEKRVRALIAQTRNQALINNLYQFASAITVFVLIYIGLTISSLSLGSLGVFLFAMFRLAPRVSNLNKAVYQIENNIPHLVRTQEFVDELKQHEEKKGGSRTPPDPITEVRFDHVSFSYKESESVLKEVSLSVKRSEFIALAGPSGGGKSTLVSLLTRLYEVDEGAISANGIDITEFDLREWRSKLAVVRQDPFIFNDTLRFNLTIGKRDASRDEIDRVCEIAQVTEFLDNLPDGYGTLLGDNGVKLSGGQRQRVALARALLKDADVLILDEATSDLDTEIERNVQRSIESMDREYTIITIAHRLSTVKNADRIYTIENGEITEAGTHQELLAANGKYAELYTVQNEGTPTK